MCRIGICRPSDSPWASPLLLVAKKDDTFRPCGDYRRLNAVTKPDRYLLPHIYDFAANLQTNFTNLLFSKLAWFGLIIKFLSQRMISRKPPSSRLLDYSNFLLCVLV